MTNAVVVADTSLPHRLGSVTVTVTDPGGAPLPGTAAQVRQTGHDFLFGNLLFDYIDWADGVAEEPARDEAELTIWRELFNFGTLPFYWRHFEPAPGAPQTERLRVAAARFQAMGITLKGHPLVWHTLAPEWLGTPATEAVIRDRIRRDVADFAGLVDIWDAINEVVIMPVFDAEANAVTPLCRRIGRLPMVKLTFDTARAANPKVTLLLNDFDLSSAYECLIEGVLKAGVAIDAIGLQTHRHQGYEGDAKLAAMLERFARYGLPLHLTEVSLVSGHLMPDDIVDLNDYQVDDWPSTPDGEARQAADIAGFYRTALANPAVAAVTYWGLTDRGAWLRAPIGLLRADGTRKPSFTALQGLIKDAWWVPPTTVVTDDEGRFDLTGFKGTYEVTAAGHTTTVHVG